MLARPLSPPRVARAGGLTAARRGQRPARPQLVRSCTRERPALTVGCRVQVWLEATDVAREAAAPGGLWRAASRASGKEPSQDGSVSPTRAGASGLQDASSTARSEADTVIRDAVQSFAGSCCSRSGSQPPSLCAHEDTHVAQWQCDDCGHGHSESACPECGDAAGFASCLYDDVVGGVCLSCGYEHLTCPECGVFAGFVPCLYDDVVGDICIACGYEIFVEPTPEPRWPFEDSFVPELMQLGTNAAQSGSGARAERSPINPLFEVHSKHLTPHSPAESPAAPQSGQLHPKHVRASRAAPPPTRVPSAPTSPWTRAVPVMYRILVLVLAAAALAAGLLAKDNLAMQRSAIAGTRQPRTGAGKRLVKKVSKRMFPLLGSASTSEARRQLYREFERRQFCAEFGGASCYIGPS